MSNKRKLETPAEARLAPPSLLGTWRALLGVADGALIAAPKRPAKIIEPLCGGPIFAAKRNCVAPGQTPVGPGAQDAPTLTADTVHICRPDLWYWALAALMERVEEEGLSTLTLEYAGFSLELPIRPLFNATLDLWGEQMSTSPIDMSSRTLTLAVPKLATEVRVFQPILDPPGAWVGEHPAAHAAPHLQVFCFIPKKGVYTTHFPANLSPLRAGKFECRDDHQWLYLPSSAVTVNGNGGVLRVVVASETDRRGGKKVSTHLVFKHTGLGLVNTVGLPVICGCELYDERTAKSCAIALELMIRHHDLNFSDLDLPECRARIWNLIREEVDNVTVPITYLLELQRAAQAAAAATEEDTPECSAPKRRAVAP